MTSVRRSDFLRAREMVTPERAVSEVGKVVADWQTQRIRLALGHEFEVTSRIVLRRPFWMPSPLYRTLLRSIVIEQKPVVDRSTRKGRA